MTQTAYENEVGSSATASKAVRSAATRSPSASATLKLAMWARASNGSRLSAIFTCGAATSRPSPESIATRANAECAATERALDQRQHGLASGQGAQCAPQLAGDLVALELDRAAQPTQQAADRTVAPERPAPLCVHTCQFPRFFGGSLPAGGR